MSVESLELVTFMIQERLHERVINLLNRREPYSVSGRVPLDSNDFSFIGVNTL